MGSDLPVLIDSHGPAVGGSKGLGERPSSFRAHEKLILIKSRAPFRHRIRSVSSTGLQETNDPMFSGGPGRRHWGKRHENCLNRAAASMSLLWVRARPSQASGRRRSGRSSQGDEETQGNRRGGEDLTDSHNDLMSLLMDSRKDRSSSTTET